MSWALDRLYFGKWRKGISGVRNNIHKDKKGKGEKNRIVCSGKDSLEGRVWLGD